MQGQLYSAWFRCHENKKQRIIRYHVGLEDTQKCYVKQATWDNRSLLQENCHYGKKKAEYHETNHYWTFGNGWAIILYSWIIATMFIYYVKERHRFWLENKIKWHDNSKRSTSNVSTFVEQRRKAKFRLNFKLPVSVMSVSVCGKWLHSFSVINEPVNEFQ